MPLQAEEAHISYNADQVDIEAVRVYVCGLAFNYLQTSPAPGMESSEIRGHYCCLGTVC